MSPATDNAGKCERCGKEVPTRDESGYCLACQFASLQADLYAAEVIEKVLGDAVAAALEYIAPSDVHDIVNKALKRTGRDGAMPLAVVHERSSRIYEAHPEVA